MDECFNINWKKFTFLANEKELNEVRSRDELLLHWNLAWLKDELVQLLHFGLQDELHSGGELLIHRNLAR